MLIICLALWLKLNEITTRWFAIKIFVRCLLKINENISIAKRIEKLAK